MQLPKGVLTIKEYYARSAAKRAKREAKAAALWVKKPKAPRPKTGSLWKTWRDRCFDLVQTLARIRDRRNGGVCRICGRAPVEVGYHIIPRSFLATAFLPRNVVGACSGCNNGERLNRLRYVDKHRKIFGALYEELDALKRTSVKYTVQDLQDIAANLRREIQKAMLPLSSP